MGDPKKPDEICVSKGGAWAEMLAKIKGFVCGDPPPPAPPITPASLTPIDWDDVLAKILADLKTGGAAIVPVTATMVKPIIFLPVGGRMVYPLMPIRCDCDACQRIRAIAEKN